MSSALKIYAGLSALTIAGSIVYKASPLFLKQITNLNQLDFEGYQYLGNFNNDKFGDWKTNFSLFRKTISNNIPILRKVKDGDTGGYLLKQWCSKKISSSVGDKEELKLIKKYCVANLKNAVLKDTNGKAIDDATPEQRKKFFGDKKNTCQHKELKDLIKWCNANFKLPYLPKNKIAMDGIKSCCVIIS